MQLALEHSNARNLHRDHVFAHAGRWLQTLVVQYLPRAQTSLEVDRVSHCWLEETALFLPGQDTWSEPKQLAVAHTDML